MCKVTNVSRSGYYAWLSRRESERNKRHHILKDAIKYEHSKSRLTYGYRRIYAQLRKQGVTAGINQIHRLMRSLKLMPHYRKRYMLTTRSKNDQKYFKNVLNRRFDTQRPNQVWVADITYIPTYEGWLYLGVVMDLFSRKVIGWDMRDTTHDDIVVNALSMAIKNRLSDYKAKNVLMHTDRGFQYASYRYLDLLAKNNITPSMSRKGNCWDNAVIESFFKTLKTELFHKKRFITKNEARMKIFEFIEVFYNKYRIHSTLNYNSPVEFEKLARAS